MRPISEHRLINFLHAHVASAALSGYAVLILCASLTPFNFSARLLPLSPILALHRAWFAPTALSDTLVNLLGYAPLGLLGWLALRGRGVARWQTLLRVPLGAAALSACCEWLQFAVPQRVASVADVFADSLGAVIGLALGPCVRARIPVLREHIETELRERPLSMAGKLLVMAMMLAFLWPLDARLTPAEIGRVARQASLRPQQRWWELHAPPNHRKDAGQIISSAAASRTQMDYLLDRCAEGAVYALLAGISLMSLRREFGFRRRWAVPLAGWTCLFVAGIVTAGRMVMASHGWDTLHVVAAAAGAAIGIIGVVLSDLDRTGQQARARAASTDWAAGAFWAVAVYVLLCELTPLRFRSTDGLSPAAFNWRPLAGHMMGPANSAALDLAGKWFAYALLGAAATWRMGAMGRLNRALQRIVPAVAAFSLAMQCIHRYMPARHADVTNVIVAALGAACGVIALRWAADYLRCVRKAHEPTADINWDQALVAAISAPMRPARAPSAEKGGPGCDAPLPDRGESQSYGRP